MSEVSEAIESYQQRKARGRPKTKTDLIHPEIRTVYVPDELQVVWTAFQEIVKREGKTVSEKIIEYVCDYARNHALGNPQQRLDVQLELKRPYRVNGCCTPECQAKPFAETFVGDKTIRFCRKHWLEYSLKHKGAPRRLIG